MNDVQDAGDGRGVAGVAGGSRVVRDPVDNGGGRGGRGSCATPRGRSPLKGGSARPSHPDFENDGARPLDSTLDSLLGVAGADSLPPPHQRPGFPDLTLVGWLRLVRARGYQLVAVDEGVVAVAPGQPGGGCHPVWRDHVAVKRWQHALQVAVARTHPEWWAFASGTSDRPPSMAQVPTSAADPDAYACAACGGPASSIDDRAVAHCGTHHPSTGWPA